MTTAWYDQLRNNHRPDVVEVLLVAESPPDPGSTDRRFFYSPTLDGKDNLYRGVATALYGREPDFDLTAKATVLRRIQRDGFWLIDLCDEPVASPSSDGWHCRTAGSSCWACAAASTNLPAN